MNTVTSQRSITNTTAHHLLVGDSSVIIGVYDSAEEAETAMGTELPGLEASACGSLRTLAPGETDSGTYSLPLPLTASRRAGIAAGRTPPET